MGKSIVKCSKHANMFDLQLVLLLFNHLDTASKGAVLAMTLVLISFLACHDRLKTQATETLFSTFLLQARTRRRPRPREYPYQLALSGTTTHTFAYELSQHTREKEPQTCACPNGQIW